MALLAATFEEIIPQKKTLQVKKILKDGIMPKAEQVGLVLKN